MFTRRLFLGGSALGLALAAASGKLSGAAEPAGGFAVSHTEAEWRQRLSPGQYAVLRESATERPFTSPLNHETRAGTFTCAGCDLDLFASKTKFDSHTGWPSFWAAIDNATGTTRDTSYFMVRTAVHCSRCGGHLGHLFEDGPPPTHLRYCMNGIAMNFRADA